MSNDKKPDPHCKYCGGTGVILHCGLCGFAVPHDVHDQLMEQVCDCDADNPQIDDDF